METEKGLGKGRSIYGPPMAIRIVIEVEEHSTCTCSLDSNIESIADLPHCSDV